MHTEREVADHWDIHQHVRDRESDLREAGSENPQALLDCPWEGLPKDLMGKLRPLVEKRLKKPSGLSVAIAALRDFLPELTMEQRLEVFSEVQAGYCRDCGIDLPEGRVCYCMNDE